MPLLAAFLPVVPLLMFSLSSIYVQSGNVVTHLPGFSGPLPFYFETGYVGVESWELFYYFVQSEGKPSEDPILLWLTGGPGCAGFNALVHEIGPLRFLVEPMDDRRMPTLVYNPENSWTNVASIIFLDSPIQSGFSFTRQPKADIVLSDTITSMHVHEFLKKWYDDHPQFLSNPLYIGGDSFGGKVVPIVTQYIVDGNDDPPFLNLKGYLIGNPCTGEPIDLDARVAYAHAVGIISDELHKEIVHEACAGKNYFSNEKFQCRSAIKKFATFINEIDESCILEPKCLSLGKKLEEFPLLEPSAFDVNCKSYAHFLAISWMNTDATREALHVKKGSDYWLRCNGFTFSLYQRDIASSLKYHINLTTRGYRALVYSGDKDLIIPFSGTIAWIKSLNFSVVEEWRSWHVDGQVAGYTEKYANNLTFATIKNAGHTAPEYQPKTSLAMFERWISQKPL